MSLKYDRLAVMFGLDPQYCIVRSDTDDMKL